jgi:hypothetical protein
LAAASALIRREYYLPDFSFFLERIGLLIIINAKDRFKSGPMALKIVLATLRLSHL